MKNHTVQLIVMLALGIAIGAIGAQLAGQGGQELRNAEPEEESVSSLDALETSVQESSSTPVSGQAELPGRDRVPKNTRAGLVVPDQQAGSAVSVSGFSFESPQWVVIYDDKDGKPWWILGAKRFLPGDVSGTVTLLRPTVAGKTYYAVVHGDDGDLTFDKYKDPAPSPDTAIIVTFQAN